MPKYYEIFVSHEAGQPCPQDWKGLQEIEPDKEMGDHWACPTHKIYMGTDPIWKVRQLITERLFYIGTLKTIKLYYGGERKVNDCYERDPLISRNWRHMFD